MLNENYQHSGVDQARFEELMRHIEEKEMEIQSLQQDFKSKGSNQDALSQYENAFKQKEMEQE